MTIEEALAASEAEPVTDDDMQFWIDEHLRVISIPKNGVVAGVEGDKNVNKIKFGMNRYYHGFDMSELSGRILYSNAKGNKNYYNITDMQTNGNTITFSWLVDADAVQYMGKTAFVVYLFKIQGSELRQKFYSTLATLKVLEGMEVDSAVPVEKQTDIIERMKEEISAYAEEVKKSLPADYTAMTEQVSSLKEEFEKGNHFIDENFQTMKISGDRYDNSYWNIETGIAVRTELDEWLAVELSVKEYEKYIVKSRPSSGVKNKFIVGTDDSYNIVCYLSELTGKENYSVVSVGVIIPNGVTKMLVSSKADISISKIIMNNYKGNLRDLNITDITECSEYGLGYFVSYSDYVGNIINLPKDFDNSAGFWLFISKAGPNNTVFYKLYQSMGKCWISVNPNNGWKSIHSYHGTFENIGIRDLNSLFDSGTYHIGTNVLPEVIGLPDEIENPCVLQVTSTNYGQGTCCQILTEYITNKQYIRWIVRNVPKEWSCIDNKIKKIEDKVNENPYSNLIVAIIGDSISTNGNEGTDRNVPEIEIMQEDVGVELSAYLTYYDVQNNLSLGGHTFTSDEIGKEVTFTPVNEDVGKVIGLPNNYNGNTVTTWWEVMKHELGLKKVIPVCWSGSSITSHEENSITRKCSHAWHDSQIRKCGIRTPGSMERTAPDVIFIYRGTNDFSHERYTVLTDKYFDSIEFEYPDTDKVNDEYGFKEGYILTIKKLREKYPNAKIFICTLNVFKRINYSHYPTNNGINTLPQYNKAIREIADFMGCDTIDFDKDGITFENCYSEGYITDSETIPTHPSNKGHMVMGKKAIEDFESKWSAMN